MAGGVRRPRVVRAVGYLSVAPLAPSAVRPQGRVSQRFFDVNDRNPSESNENHRNGMSAKP